MITTAPPLRSVESDRPGSATALRPTSTPRPIPSCGRIVIARTGEKLLALILGGLLLPLALAALARAQNPGDLDTSFSEDGIVVAPAAVDGGGSGMDSEGRAVVSTAADSPAVLGPAGSGWYRVGFEVDPSGTPLATFDGDSDPDNDGLAQNNSGNCDGQYSDAVHRACSGVCVVGSTGDFFAAGSKPTWGDNSWCDQWLERFFAVLKVSASAGTETAVLSTKIEGYEAEAFGIAESSSDGALIAVGTRYSTPSRVALVRLVPTYNLFVESYAVDPSFGGGDGIITHAIGSGGADAYEVALQSDGKIVVVGRTGASSADAKWHPMGTGWFVARFTTSGALDSSFGTGGVVTVALGSGQDAAVATGVQIASDGDIVVSGKARGVSCTGFLCLDYGSGFVRRYNSAGVLDTTFGGGDGVVTKSSSIFEDVVLDSAGRITAVGSMGGGILGAGFDGNALLVRYTADGTLDPTFGGGDGTVTFAEPAGFTGIRITSAETSRDSETITVGGTIYDSSGTDRLFLARVHGGPICGNGTVETGEGCDLGDGTNGPRADSVSAGEDHTCALTTGGGVKCWGKNSHGELGDGTTTGRSTPVWVSGLTTGVAAVSAGKDHTCAVTTGGGVKCWGTNYGGELGDGTATDRMTPVWVSGLTTGVVAVSAGGGHTCAVTTAGGLKCWGWNIDGELGDGTDTRNRWTPVWVSGLTTGVATVSAGGGHTCAVTTAGGLKCWGGNYFGSLGDGTTTDRRTPVWVSGLTTGVAAVSAGYGHTCAVTTVGGLKCWGWNGSGQLGDGTWDDRPTPVAVGGLTTGVAAVSMGHWHTCAVTTAGGLKCWGSDHSGQAGGCIRDLHRFTPGDVAGFGHEEGCDGPNGASDNCCTSECEFVTVGTECRAGAGDPNGSGFVCDPAETCSGASGVCPSDAQHAGEICRTGTGDLCDPHETCPAGAGSVCSPDVVEGAGTVCGGDSGDACDPAEVCDGIAGHGCPTNVIEPAGTVCRAGSGDSCDPAETCTGVASEPCPANLVSAGGTVCRDLADPTCDIAERCTGIMGQVCPPDVGWPAATVCRTAVDVCDLTETCAGATTCPADLKKPDQDADTLCDEIDNCVAIANLTQTDGDSDEVGDVCDNCPDICNPDQDDADGDSGGGDVCDVCPAIDEAAEPTECATAEYNSELACCRAMSSAGVSVDADGPSCGNTGNTSFQTPPDPTTGATVTVEIPAGAVDGPTSISVTPMTQGGGDFILSTVVGKFVTGAIMEPAGMSFDPPLLVCMAWQDADNNGRVDNLEFVVEEANIRPTLHDETTLSETVLGPRCGLQRQCGALGVDGLPATVPGNLDNGSLRACCSAADNVYCFEVTHFSAYAIADLSCAGEAQARLIGTRMNQAAGTQGLQVKGAFDLGGPIPGGFDPRASGFELVIQSAGDRPLYQVTLPPGAYSRATGEGWKMSPGGGSAQWQSKIGISGVKKVKLAWDDATGQGSFEIKGKGLKLVATPADLPLQAEVRLDPATLAGRCGLATFTPPGGMCAFNSSAATLLCQ